MTESLLRESDLVCESLDVHIVLAYENIPKAKDTTKFQLMIFASGNRTTNTPAHGLLRSLVDFDDSIPESHITRRVPIWLDRRFLPDHLHFMLYAKHNNYNELIGNGVMYIDKSYDVPQLFDITGAVIGYVAISTSFINEIVPVNVHPRPLEKEEIMKKLNVYASSKNITIDNHSFYAYVTTFFGAWPLLTWTYLVTSVSGGSKTNALIRMLFKCAVGDTSVEKLCDALTMITRNMPYRNDVVYRKGGNQKVPSEFWNRLCVHPMNATRLAYDCDDGGEFIMELMYYIQKNIYELIETGCIPSDMMLCVTRYTPFLTIGTILDEATNQYSPHVWVTLIDSKYFETKITKGNSIGYVADAILLCESTASMQGSIHDYKDTSGETTWNKWHSSSYYKRNSASQDWISSLNVRRPASSYMKKESYRKPKYGTVSTLLAVHHQPFSKVPPRMLHILVTDTTNNTCGAPFDRFMTGCHQVKYNIYEEYKTNTFASTCGAALYLEPASRLPECTVPPEWTFNATSYKDLFELNSTVYQANKKEIHEAGFTFVDFIPLTEDLIIVQLSRQ